MGMIYSSFPTKKQQVFSNGKPKLQPGDVLQSYDDKFIL